MRGILHLAVLAATLALAPALEAGDWPDWRGPERDGRSPETGLPESWSPDGENLVWRAPFGSRSTPIVVGDRVFLQTSVAAGETLQERVVCLDADSGKLLWEHRFNVYLSDVPPHRVAWASPVADPASGHVYAFGVGGPLLALSRDGKLLWHRSLGEEFGLITTHGGRTVSPVVEGELVIVSGVSSGWGEQGRGGFRVFAFDKTSGETVYVSAPAGAPYDTTYSPPLAAVVGGRRLLILGGSDGAVHALEPQTGRPVWRFEMSKRGINTGALVHGTRVVVSHSEENLDTSEMGLLAAFDAAASGEIPLAAAAWSVTGFLAGFSSPVLDGERFYQIDNGANLAAFDVATGRRGWSESLGTIQRASPVLADGKLYVGTENGSFYILQPGPDGVTLLDRDALGSEAEPEVFRGSAAVSNGRVFFATSEATYCIGRKRVSPETPKAENGAPPDPNAEPAHVQVVPTELILAPGEKVAFSARLYDAQGRFLREAEDAAWSLAGLSGTLGPDGGYVAGEGPRAGKVTAALGGLSGAARARIVPPLPWSVDFEGDKQVPGHWVNAGPKFELRALDGSNVLVKRSDNPFLRRARVYMGRTGWSDYSVQADVRAIDKRRQMGDAGVIAQRYALILFGNHQRLELQPWQPETARTAIVPFAWKPDTWYRLKLRVENRADGTVLARGKAWLASEPEPEAWTIERVDPIGNREGSPGIYADAAHEVFFDNLVVKANAPSERKAAR